MAGESALRRDRRYRRRQPHSARTSAPAQARWPNGHPRRQRVRRAIPHPRREGRERKAAHPQPPAGCVRANAERIAMSARAVAVGFLATATLAFEILLVRVFAVEHFHHVAYMAIGVAMLGIGATGAFIAAIGELSRDTAERWFRLSTLLTTLSLVVVPVALHRISLDLTQLAWNAEQWVLLGVVYLLLALPFAFGALAILLAITLESARPGWMYGASFLGSGVGALLAIAILWVAHPSRALAFPAVVGGVGTIVVARPRGREIGPFSAALGAMVVASVALARPPWRMVVSSYKGLPQVEAYPDARRVAERTSPLGWVVAVRAPAFRHAPGLSLAYVGEFPPQTALFVDGEIAGAVTRLGASGSDRSTMEILAW